MSRALVTGVLTRRGFMLTAAAVPLALNAAEFWVRKDPGSWSSEETQEILTHSPWAKSVRVDLLKPNPERYAISSKGPMMEPGGPAGGPTVDTPIGGAVPGRGFGGYPTDPGRDRSPATTPVDALTVVVRFLSAEPMRLAQRIPLPPEFAGRYIVGVTAFPMIAPKSDVEDTLRSSATLEAKGKGPENPGEVGLSKDKSEVLFGFSREFMTLAAADRDLTFTLNTGEISLRAKFSPKDMIYRGRFTV